MFKKRAMNFSLSSLIDLTIFTLDTLNLDKTLNGKPRVVTRYPIACCNRGHTSMVFASAHKPTIAYSILMPVALTIPTMTLLLLPALLQH